MVSFNYYIAFGFCWYFMERYTSPLEEKKSAVTAFYDGIYHLLQLVPPDISSITLATDTSLHTLLLNPNQSEWASRFRARRLHVVVNSFGPVQFVNLHPQTVRFSKIISRFPGPPLLNVDNIDLLYYSISAQL